MMGIGLDCFGESIDRIAAARFSLGQFTVCSV